MIHADDTHVHIVLDHESYSALLIPKIERCVDDIKRWSTANDLKLNGDKTDVLHITSEILLLYHVCKSIKLSTERILGKYTQSWSNSSKRLKNGSFCQQNKPLCFICIFKIGQIRKLLDRKCTGMLVHAYITCRLD